MTIRLAMIGTGRIAETRLIGALQKTSGAQLWSVMSRDLSRAEEFARRWEAAAPTPAHDNLDSLLADADLDGVIIATPDKLHGPQALQAAQAGKHVLVEKPMVTSRREGAELLRACEDGGIKLAVAYHLRWHPAQRAVHEAAQRGEFGDLRHMRVMWNWKAGDGEGWRAHPDVGRWWSLAGVGTHCLDQVLWFLAPDKDELVEMNSLIANPVWQVPHDETALLSLRFASGATAEICSSVLFQAPTRFELYGSEGYAIGDGTMSTTGEGVMNTHKGTLAFTPNDPYVGEIEDFVDAIVNDRAPEVDGAMGMRNCEILLRAIGE